MEHICFDKMHALNEVRMPRFAFYDSATVEVTGTFSGEVRTVSLRPDFRNPNCFEGVWELGLQAEAGKDYELNASITWDSAGKKTTSNFHAKTTIPQRFEVIKAYDLMGKLYGKGGRILYLPPPMDLKSNYFIPDYSDDVAGVLVSIVYDKDIYWGENFMTQLAAQFMGNGDDSITAAAQLAKFGDRQKLYFARNMEVMGTLNEIDSIPIMGLMMPAEGGFKLLFYATTEDYIKYRDSYLNGADDSRMKAVYNIEGGAGIFAGMLVDTFDVRIQASPDVKIYSYHDAQASYCSREDFQTKEIEWKTSRRCIEIWDSQIWWDIYCKELEKDGQKCTMLIDYENSLVVGYKLEKDGVMIEENLDLHHNFGGLSWYDIPPEKIKELLSEEEFITWCKFRDFPIYEYHPCGSAMVRFSKDNKGSPVLEREVKKWCEENEGDAECG